MAQIKFRKAYNPAHFKVYAWLIILQALI